MGSGFENRTSSIIEFDDTTRTFTISPVEELACYYWHRGVRWVLRSPSSIIVPDITGIHFFYFDESLLKSATVDFQTVITRHTPIAVVYWDTDTQTSIIFGDERHGREMNCAVHLYNHATIGARWGRGLQPVNVIHGSGDDDTDAQIGIEGGTFWDEDIEFTIPPQSIPLQTPFLYRVGKHGKWKRSNPTGFVALSIDPNKTAVFNKWDGLTWSLQHVTNNDYFCMHLLCTNDQRHPFMWIVGQRDYLALSQARAGASIEFQNLRVGPLEQLLPEFVFIATFICQTSTLFINKPKVRIIASDMLESFVDLRRV